AGLPSERVEPRRQALGVMTKGHLRAALVGTGISRMLQPARPTRELLAGLELATSHPEPPNDPAHQLRAQCPRIPNSTVHCLPSAIRGTPRLGRSSPGSCMRWLGGPRSGTHS